MGDAFLSKPLPFRGGVGVGAIGLARLNLPLAAMSTAPLGLREPIAQIIVQKPPLIAG
jgi:hypothetical protein